jgi:hypothetical protein
MVGFVVLLAGESGAHPGGLNAEGCHNNRKTGEYHCHGGTERSRPDAIESREADRIVKKSRRAICHTPESPWYQATVHYVAYPTLKACLDSGGRLPRG